MQLIILKRALLRCAVWQYHFADSVELVVEEVTVEFRSVIVNKISLPVQLVILPFAQLVFLLTDETTVAI